MDMRTPVQRKNWRTWITQEQADMPSNVAHGSNEASSSEAEAWDKTDRQLQFSGRHRSAPRRASASLQAPSDNPARDRWLEENDVHTQFLDAGIGCCWFAQQGDQEPVSGETEDEAIKRLAREKGLVLWHEA
jgi:hypothetical protein